MILLSLFFIHSPNFSFSGKKPDTEWEKLKSLTAEENFAFVSTHTRNEVVTLNFSRF